MQQPIFPSDRSQRVRFGVFDVDFTARELRKQGVRIKLQEKPFQLLAALLERPGEVVSREDLRKALWGEQTFVDFERSLNIAITKLRSSLGDSAESPRFIETLPRRGYRFIAPVNIPGSESGVDSMQRQTLTNDVPPPVHSSTAPYLKRVIFHRSFLISLLAFTLLTMLSFALNIAGLKDNALGRRKPFHPESIAVLPFENFSGDSQQEYLVDGITDALITDLGRLSALRVLSRTSIMRYKGTKKSLPEIARELRADAIVEGAVVQSGNRIRITIQLLDALSDRHLWAKTFEREIHDVLALQDDVAEAIAREIQSTIHPRQARPVNPDAWVLYLRGRYFWAKRGGEELKKGLEYFEQAIQKDPDYALGYAGLADSYLFLAIDGVLPQGEMVPKAREAALKALQLDDELAEAHTSLAGVKCTFEGDWAGAEKEYKRAFEINPNYALAHQWWATTLAGVGRQLEAEAEIRRAEEIDPLSLPVNAAAGTILYYSRQYPQALDQFKKTLELDPNFAPAHIGLGRVYRELRMKEESLAELETGAALFHRRDSALAALGHAYGVLGYKDQALKILAELEDRSSQKYVEPVSLGIVYLGLRDYDRAFESLRLAVERQTSSLSALKVAPEFDPVRSDPRFSDLLRRARLAP